MSPPAPRRSPWRLRDASISSSNSTSVYTFMSSGTWAARRARSSRSRDLSSTGRLWARLYVATASAHDMRRLKSSTICVSIESISFLMSERSSTVPPWFFSPAAPSAGAAASCYVMGRLGRCDRAATARAPAGSSGGRPAAKARRWPPQRARRALRRTGRGGRAPRAWRPSRW